MFKVLEDFLAYYGFKQDDSAIKGNTNTCKSISDNEILASNRRYTKKDLTCDVCNKTFPEMRNLKRHKQFVHDVDNINYLPCEYCNKLFKRTESLRCHLKNFHLRKADNLFALGFQCEICNKKFNSKSSLWNHKRNVHVNYNFSCHLCERKFKNKLTLNCHVKSVHLNENLTICSVCGKSVKCINSHMVIVHGERKTLTCDLCNKVYSSERNLKTHQRHSHSNKAKDHMCEVCGASFQFKNLLENHYVVHSSERNYKCHICDKTFKLKSVLRTHQRVHNTFTPYECKICGFKFKWKQTYEKHLTKCEENKDD